MLIVAALGGNALLRRGEPPSAEEQRRTVRRATEALAELVVAGHSIVITHGNGPQVGLLALQAAAAGPAFPLDVLDAESAGMIGYLIQQELGNVLGERRIVTLLTQVKVDARDEAFQHPTKPIGPSYEAATAQALAADRGWQIAEDNGKWRRVVASPRPTAIVEAGIISLLVEHKVIVICSGGGGIPVVEQAEGSLVGVEAVVDKDFASALLARQLKAEMLLLLTDVDAVYSGFGTPAAKPLRRVCVDDIRSSDFPVGSMAPKVEAAAEFVRSTGRRSAIGRLEDAGQIVTGDRGTIFPAAIKAGTATSRCRFRLFCNLWLCSNFR